MRAQRVHFFGERPQPAGELRQLADECGAVGTLQYMAPEVLRGEPTDVRSDLWAFGVVLFEMLTGQRLFHGETISDTLASVLKSEPDWTQVPAQARRAALGRVSFTSRRRS